MTNGTTDIDALMKRVRERRAAAGLAVPYVRRTDGIADVMYCVSEEAKAKFLTKCAVNGTEVQLQDYNRKDLLAAEYIERIGYNPFEDDPEIEVEEVAAILLEYGRFAAEVEAAQ